AWNNIKIVPGMVWLIANLTVNGAYFDLHPFTTAYKNLIPLAQLDEAFEQGAGDDEMLNFVGTFVDSGHAQVAVPAFDGHLAGVAHAAVHLHHAVNDAVSHVRAEEFSHAGLVAVVLVAVGFPGGVERKPFGGLDFNGGVGDHPLDGLAVRDGLAKGDALLGVVDSHL